MERRGKVVVRWPTRDEWEWWRSQWLPVIPRPRLPRRPFEWIATVVVTVTIGSMLAMLVAFSLFGRPPGGVVPMENCLVWQGRLRDAQHDVAEQIRAGHEPSPESLAARDEAVAGVASCRTSFPGTFGRW